MFNLLKYLQMRTFKYQFLITLKTLLINYNIYLKVVLEKILKYILKKISI